jgi:pyrroline-5-carboxylate reductase
MNTATSSVSAIFASRETARQAVASLHAHHFRSVWSGVTSLTERDGGAETVAIEAPGFFSLKSQSLVDALVEHGVDAETARGIEPIIAAGEVIVIVDPGERDASEAARLLEADGGELSEAVMDRGTPRAGATTFSAADRVPEGIGEDDDGIVYVEEIFYLTILE